MKKRLPFFGLILLLLIIASTVILHRDDIMVSVPAAESTEQPESSAALLTPEPSPVLTPEPAPEMTLAPTPDLTGLALNPLTGYYIDEAAAARRPVAVVINNLKKALPQSGLSQADLYYEVLAEADITRIVAIFTDFDSKKIGPIRSARHYFMDFALDNDAVFVHHGGSPQAYDAIPSLKINNLDGMKLEGSSFFRDSVRKSQPGMLEHSSYTSAEGIFSSIKKYGYRSDKLEDFDYGFRFYVEPASPITGKPASKVTVPFSNIQQSIFEYDKESRLYKRFQGTSRHIDEETGEQLTVSNVIIQLTNMYVIAGDTEGRREVDLVGKGTGYMLTAGTYIPITWSKKNHSTPTLYYDENEQLITINKGKTWICVFQKTGTPTFE